MKAFARIRRRCTHRLIEANGRAMAILGEADWVMPNLKRVGLGWHAGTPMADRVHWHGLDPVAALWRLARRHGVAVAVGVPLAAAKAGEVLHAPRLVALSRRTPSSLAEFRQSGSNSLRSDLRLIKRNGFTWSWDPDRSHLPEFWAHYHLPSIDAVHGAEQLTISREEMAAVATSDRHHFLRVFRDGQWVAGLVIEISEDCLHMRQLGWRDGAAAERRAGVIGALYLASVERAIEQRIGRISFGVVEPLLENGLMIYKTKWGGVLDQRNTRPLSLCWAIDPAHPGGRRFFSEHTMVVWSSDRRFAVLGAKSFATCPAFPPLAEGFSHRYRLRDQPDPAGGTENAGLPRALRPWFVAE